MFVVARMFDESKNVRILLTSACISVQRSYMYVVSVEDEKSSVDCVQWRCQHLMVGAVSVASEGCGSGT